MKRALTGFLSLFLIAGSLTAATVGSRQRPPKSMDAAQLELALHKLRVVGNVLYIAAHPDDENTAMIAWLSNGKLMRTGYLAMNRGSGGQNLIGDEKGDLLGVIRTEELLEARGVDGGEQFFTRAIDFGYSKSPEETLRIWGHDTILADVVWVVRNFRPDVIITRFPTDGRGGHGHHTASAMLALEAFQAAGDPTKFPEQLQYVSTWSPRRIFWNAWRPDLENRPADAPPLLKVDLGEYSPLLGRSWGEIAGESRSMHKSQGFGASQRRGTLVNYLEQMGGSPAVNDPFEGIDTSWSRIPGGERVDALLAKAIEEWNPQRPSAVVPDLVGALEAMRALPSNGWIETKKADLEEVIRNAAGLWLEAISAQPSVTAGESLPVTFTAIARSGIPVRIESLTAAFSTASSETAGDLTPNEPKDFEVKIPVPAGTAVTQPLWLREPHGPGTYTIPEQPMIGKPEAPARLTVDADVKVGGTTIRYTVPVLYRWTDRVEGELYRAAEIVPPVTANPESTLYVFPDLQPKAVDLILRSGRSNVSGSVSLQLPEGWSSKPASVPFTMDAAGAEQSVSFKVTPAAGPARAAMKVLVSLGGAPAEAMRMETIDYPHIPREDLFPAASADLVRTDIETRGRRIGYVTGSGDEVPDALRQLGYQVGLLTDDILDAGDLSAYDAIVIGVRAFNTRDRLINQQSRLLDYVKAGGTLVVQYNTLEQRLQGRIGPWPMEISHDRVTVEEAPMKVLVPDSPLLNEPNAIGAADFEGWVQERGLYFPRTWDPHYTPLFESHDPGEEPLRGALLYSRYGKGMFIETGISFFRQLPAGVPGAYRLFANLVSAR